MAEAIEVASNEFAIKTRHPWFVFRLITLINSTFVGITGPLEVVFFLSIGFNPAQIGALLAVQALGTLVSDIPTSAFADRYGRKMSLIISYSILALVFCAWFFVQSYPVFIFLSFVWGIGFAFQSGAKTALLIDHLSLSVSDDRRTHAFAHLAVYGNIGLFIGGLIAAAVASNSIRWIWAAAALIQTILVVITWVGLQNDTHKPTIRLGIRTILFDTFNGIKAYFTRMPLPLLLILEATTTFILSAYMIVIPLFLRLNWHINDSQFGLLGSLAAGTGIIGALLGERINRKWGFRTTALLFALILMVLFLGLASSQLIIIVIACYALIELFLFGWDPIEQSLVNRYLPNANRTVMLSVGSSANLVIRSISQIIAGFILIVLQPRMFIVILGFLFLAWPIITSLLLRIHTIPYTIEKKVPLGNQRG